MKLAKIFIFFIVILTILTSCATPDKKFIELSDINAEIEFNLPTGLATDSVDNLYIFDSGSQRVLKFDKDGNFLIEWGGYGTEEGKFNCHEDKGTICGLAVDSQNHIYVVDKGNYRIQKFDAEGNFLTSWGTQGTGNGQFIRPIYVAVDLQGNVFVTDDRNPVIQKFDKDGQFLLKWGSFGTKNGQFRHATGIATDSEGNVYISDYTNRVVQKFDNNGTFLAAWKTGENHKSGTPEALVIDHNDRIYITDSKLKQIEIFNSEGVSLKSISLEGAGLFNRISPYGIAINSSGYLFVSDRKNHRVLKYTKPVLGENKK